MLPTGLRQRATGRYAALLRGLRGSYGTHPQAHAWGYDMSPSCGGSGVRRRTIFGICGAEAQPTRLSCTLSIRARSTLAGKLRPARIFPRFWRGRRNPLDKGRFRREQQGFLGSGPGLLLGGSGSHAHPRRPAGEDSLAPSPGWLVAHADGREYSVCSVGPYAGGVRLTPASIAHSGFP